MKCPIYVIFQGMGKQQKNHFYDRNYYSEEPWLTKQCVTLIFERFSCVRLCLLSVKIHLYILNVLSTSVLVMGANFRLAMSDRERPLGRPIDVDVPVKHSPTSLTMWRPGFFLRMASSLVLIMAPLGPGIMLTLFSASFRIVRASVRGRPGSSNLVMASGMKSRCARMKAKSILTLFVDSIS